MIKIEFEVKEEDYKKLCDLSSALNTTVDILILGSIKILITKSSDIIKEHNKIKKTTKKK